MNRALATRRGYTLVEVIISVLLGSFLISALFGVALSTKSSSVRTDRKLLATQATKTLQNQLKPYITPDAGSVKPGSCGPNFANKASAGCDPFAAGCCTAAMWCLSTPGVQTDNYAGGVNPCQVAGGAAPPPCYALGPGIHTLTCQAAGPPGDNACVLPASMRRQPFVGTVSYTVTNTCPPRVTVNVDWTEP